MTYSRISRVEEKKTKKILVLTFIGIVTLLVMIFTIGIPLIIGVSLLVSNATNHQSIIDNTDKTPPVAPVLFPVPIATNSAILKISGYGEPNSNVHIFVNDTEVKKILLPTDGSFSFTDKLLMVGQNVIYVTAQDQAGNLSTESEKLKILYKKNVPKLEITDPQDNQTFSKNQQDLIIKGITEEGVNLTINDRFVNVKDDGAFTSTLRLQDGENTLVFVARDTAGNETKLEKKVFYSL